MKQIYKKGRRTMNKETFVKITDELTEFYREIYPKYDELGIMPEDNPILSAFDKILEAVHVAVDPKNIGENLLTHDTPLIFDYIFEHKPACVKTSGDLYDYIKTLYEKHEAELKDIQSYRYLLN